MVSIEQIKNTYEQIKPLLEDENVKRYGSLLIKAGKTGGKKIMGHFETVRQSGKVQMLGNAGGNPAGVANALAGNAPQMLQQISGSVPGMLGGLTSLGWANLAVSGITLGVTIAGMVIMNKKLNALSADIQQINGKLDGIVDEMRQMRAMIVQLNKNEIYKLYREANTDIRQMKDLALELENAAETGNSAVHRDAKRLLNQASGYLEDALTRYMDTSCDIAIGLDVIMAYFQAFASLLKGYISSEYLLEQKKIYYTDYEQSLRLLCSRQMVQTLQAVYMQTGESFADPRDIGLITGLYKSIMAEQVQEIKSQRQILDIMDIGTYRSINERLMESSPSSDLVFANYG